MHALTARAVHLTRLVIVLIPALAAGSAVGVAAGDEDETSPPTEARIEIRMTPRMVRPGGAVRARIRTERDELNRLLSVVLDAPSYYARSDFDMPGADSAIVRDLVYESLPDGVYAVSATLFRADGSRRRATSCFVVQGPGTVAPAAPGVRPGGALDASNTPLPPCP